MIQKDIIVAKLIQKNKTNKLVDERRSSEVLTSTNFS